MELSVVLHSISLIGMMITIGVILGQFTPINDNTKKVYTLIIVNIAMPCIILSSIFKINIEQNMLKNIVYVFLLSIVINLIGIALGWLLATPLKNNRKLRQEISILSGLGNTGFIGIPLCAAILGPEGALYAAIFDAGVDFTIWTVGAMILRNTFSLSWKTFKSIINIPVIAIIMGLTFALVNYRPPEIFIDLTNHLAALASPLAMFYIGLLTVSKSKQSNINKSNQVIPIITKLLLLPIISLLIIYLLPFQMEEITKNVLIIQAMMPTLTISSILFTKYNKNAVFGAYITVLSTLLCLLTIPLLLWLFNNQKLM